MSEDREIVSANGCGEDSGYDYYEDEVRQIFEDYAKKQGFNLSKHVDYPWWYASLRTNEAWDMFHIGHVAGRTFKVE